MKFLIDWFKGHRFHFPEPAVTAFGSARFKEGHRYYSLAHDVCAAVAKEGYTIVTGGGPGLMEASNRGAKSVSGGSAGINIIMHHEQRHNNYLDYVTTVKYFFIRKLFMVKHSRAFLIFPGGYGTLDELFEVFTLIQKKMHRPSPIILIGREYWQGLLDWMEKTVVAREAMDPREFGHLQIADTPEEVVGLLRITSRQSHALPVPEAQ